MKRVFIGLVAALILGLFLNSQAIAQTPSLSVKDKDGMVYLKGGFSDGSSAAGVKILIVEDKPYKGGEKVELYNGKKVLKKTKLDKNGELTVEKPKGPYLIIFDAGAGKVVEKKGPLLKAGKKKAGKKK